MTEYFERDGQGYLKIIQEIKLSVLIWIYETKHHRRIRFARHNKVTLLPLLHKRTISNSKHRRRCSVYNHLYVFFLSASQNMNQRQNIIKKSTATISIGYLEFNLNHRAMSTPIFLAALGAFGMVSFTIWQIFINRFINYLGKGKCTIIGDLGVIARNISCLPSVLYKWMVLGCSRMLSFSSTTTRFKLGSYSIQPSDFSFSMSSINQIYEIS